MYVINVDYLLKRMLKIYMENFKCVLEKNKKSREETEKNVKNHEKMRKNVENKNHIER